MNLASQSDTAALRRAFLQGHIALYRSPILRRLFRDLGLFTNASAKLYFNISLWLLD